jgi:hypothetical protein
VTRTVRLAFLAPDIVEAIIRGDTRAGIDARKLTLDRPPPAPWHEQRQMMMPG